MDMNVIKDMISPELLVLIPVLYLIGMVIKRNAFIPDKYIPVILGVCGIVLAGVWILGSGVDNVAAAIFASLTQGILCAGASVYINQLIKQGGDRS